MDSTSSFLHAEANVTVAVVVDCWLNNCTAGFCYYDQCFPAPPPNSTDDATQIQIHHPDRLLPNLLISAGSLLGASFLLLLTLYVVLRRRRRRRRLERSQQNSPSQNEDDLFNEEGEGDHHVWYIRTVGLDDQIIKSIAAVSYKAADGLVEGSDCSVCLAEFEEGELLRLLPKCSHAFHLPCIDTWLRSHVNCPLCRAPIVAPSPAAAASSSSDQVDLESGSSTPTETSQTGIQPRESDHMMSEEEKDAGIGIGIVIDSIAGPSSELPAKIGEDGLQPVRRSVSMDSASMASFLFREEPEERVAEERKEPEYQEGRISKNKGKQGNSPKGAFWQKGTSEMKRSLSSRSDRFFFPRCGRARNSNSVLPL